jgi:N-acetylneuraminate synthase/N,N'-diacetyllegionaminate synthase
VKFQTFHADRLMVASHDRFAHQGNGGESAYQMFRRLELSMEDHRELKRQADKRGVIFLSTPFDEESVDFLYQLGVPAFKVSSSDATHIPLLKRIGAKGKPVLLSTGMCYLSEIAAAIWTLKSAGAKELLLLHCVSAYPASPESLNLRAIQTLIDHFGLPVGYSDHSQGTLYSLMAACLGATLIEKHFTLDKNAPGPDHRSSVDRKDLKSLIRNLRKVEVSLGDGKKQPVRVEGENRTLSRRSIVTAVDVRAYETIAPWMVTYKRPGTGIEPSQAEKVIGMCARRDLPRNTILQWDDLIASVLPDTLSAAVEDGSPSSHGATVNSASKCDA